MKAVILDTSAYSVFKRGHAGITLALQNADAIYFSPIVLGELLSGFRNGNRREENLQQLRRFMGSPRVKLAVVDEETAERYAIIQETLLGDGKPIPTNDVWIAASAMQHGLALLTTDAHFLKVGQIMTAFYALKRAR